MSAVSYGQDFSLLFVHVFMLETFMFCEKAKLYHTKEALCGGETGDSQPTPPNTHTHTHTFYVHPSASVHIHWADLRNEARTRVLQQE